MASLSRHFLFIALLGAFAALLQPSLFIWIRPFIPLLLGLIMFAMGTTVTGHELSDVWLKRRFVFLGLLLQFSVMPLLAVLLSWGLRLPEEFLVGMIIVGSCPGGTASNVIVYLFRGNVALSVAMTLLSTLAAPLLTPGLVYLLLHRSVELSFFSLLLSVLQVVALPLLLGMLVRRYFSDAVSRAQGVFPGMSVIAITLIVASVVALQQKQILGFPLLLVIAVMLHNLLGIAAGYSVSRIAGGKHDECRTVAIEVGMQNSGLGVALAHAFFPAAAALPAALFSLWHNLSGMLFARFWSGGNKKSGQPGDVRSS